MSLSTNRRSQLILKPGKERSLLRRHLWLFSGAVARQEGEAADGDLIDLVNDRGEWLAVGHFQRTGSIRCRVLSFHREAAPESGAFWREQIGNAVALRAGWNLLRGEATNCCRLVHGEGDRLPGLIVDWYNGVAVVQFHSLGMFRQQNLIAQAVREALERAGCGVKAIYIKTERRVHLRGDDGMREGFFDGESGPVVVSENGVRFSVDFVNGQKTGFFLDQRENRELVRRYAQGKSACNLFAYTGGFSAYALLGGAKLLDSVEISKEAMERLEENLQLNGVAENHRSFCQDAFNFFSLAQERYELIVLDPPAFAKHREAIPQALKGYRGINRSALRNIAPGGLLFTFSCSQLISPELFRETLFSAAAQAGREVRILRELHQGPDHPVNLFHPEGSYLKGLLLQVE